MSDFGSDPDGSGFNAISKEYKASPTIENYVRLRRQYPEGEVEIAMSGGIEFLYSQEEELRSHGLDPETVEGFLYADMKAQAELSLCLLEKLIERKKIQKSGETHIVSRKKAISDTLVNYLIASALDGLSWSDNLKISRELIVLIKYQLGSPTSQYEIEEEKREQRREAEWIAMNILAEGRTPTYREIGRALGVQASTVMRWFPKGNFIADMKSFKGSVKEVSRR